MSRKRYVVSWPVVGGLSGVTAVALFAFVVVVGGCSESGESVVKPAAYIKRGPQSGPASLSTIKSELATAKAQLAATIEALNELQESSTGDEAPAKYKAFADAYLELKSKSDAVAQRSADLKQQVADHHAVWKREVGLVDPQLRDNVLQRQADAERIFNTINTELEKTRNSFHPLMASLKELDTYYRDNRVSARLDSVGVRVSKTNVQAKAVEVHAAAIIATIEEITTATGETIAPTKVN